MTLKSATPPTCGCWTMYSVTWRRASSSHRHRLECSGRRQVAVSEMQQRCGVMKDLVHPANRGTHTLTQENLKMCQILLFKFKILNVVDFSFWHLNVPSSSVSLGVVYLVRNYTGHAGFAFMGQQLLSVSVSSDGESPIFHSGWQVSNLSRLNSWTTSPLEKVFWPLVQNSVGSSILTVR